MFLFNSLHQGSLASKLRRHWARNVFTLFVMFSLSTALLFTGCNLEPEDTGFIPVGEWTSDWDGYIITDTSVKYDDGYGVLEGTIEKAVDFSSDAGVLIIKITVSSDFTVGKFTGVYYADYTSTSIKLANVWLEGSGGYYPLEADSVSAAESLFNVDNVGTHVTYWGVYTKK